MGLRTEDRMTTSWGDFLRTSLAALVNMMPLLLVVWRAGQKEVPEMLQWGLNKYINCLAPHRV